MPARENSTEMTFSTIYRQQKRTLGEEVRMNHKLGKDK
jgi:hypothetical protein